MGFWRNEFPRIKETNEANCSRVKAAYRSAASTAIQSQRPRDCKRSSKFSSVRYRCTTIETICQKMIMWLNLRWRIFTAYPHDRNGAGTRRGTWKGAKLSKGICKPLVSSTAAERSLPPLISPPLFFTSGRCIWMRWLAAATSMYFAAAYSRYTRREVQWRRGSARANAYNVISYSRATAVAASPRHARPVPIAIDLSHSDT